ncbi:putative NOP5 family protein [Candidatus Bilamarchaeum dharawalense]|uniref:Putative NOP5 family protein n=1 Tax=Candidatus Bilamarchaeum dharawalense TaxID=2885759 RepID=A0A5E4LPW3_9ARCH|nr:putative NOP5 family protein [Candidatus Bilamarchaeum dharawalense]
MGKPQRNFRGPSRGPSDKEFADKRERFLKRTRQAVMEALKSRDMLLGTVTRSIEDLDKTINLLGEKLEDWYAIYFPELKAEDKLQYAKATLVIDRENIDEKEVATIFGQKKASEVIAASKTSLGVQLSPRDLSECISLSRMIVSLEKLRKEYEIYQKELAEELCPNLSEVGGADIAAKLVSHMGTLSRLAMLPASAIQVIGAEKALFKHLKNRKVPPPKHGIIFQHAKISSAPKAVRGKIARTLANKLCLAAKADAFTKRRISAELRKDFDERVAQIMKDYELEKAKPKPDPIQQNIPPSKPVQQQKFEHRRK